MEWAGWLTRRDEWFMIFMIMMAFELMYSIEVYHVIHSEKRKGQWPIIFETSLWPIWCLHMSLPFSSSSPAKEQIFFYSRTFVDRYKKDDQEQYLRSLPNIVGGIVPGNAT
jgi:hypothetical protein